MTAIESINSLLDEMKPMLLLAGVPIECLKIKNKKYRIDACNRAFDWLHNLKISPEYEKITKVRALLPEKTWERYDLFEIIDLREQVLLSKAKRELLRKWNIKRPAMFQRKRNGKRI